MRCVRLSQWKHCVEYMIAKPSCMPGLLASQASIAPEKKLGHHSDWATSRQQCDVQSINTDPNLKAVGTPIPHPHNTEERPASPAASANHQTITHVQSAVTVSAERCRRADVTLPGSLITRISNNNKHISAQVHKTSAEGSPLGKVLGDDVTLLTCSSNGSSNNGSSSSSRFR